MRYCENCGKEVPDGMNYCENCGAGVEQPIQTQVTETTVSGVPTTYVQGERAGRIPSEAEQKAQQSSSNMKYLGIALLLILIVSIVAIEFQISQISDQQIDSANRIKIPSIIAKKMTVSNVLVDQIAGSSVTQMKNWAGQYGLEYVSLIDMALPVLKTVINTKLSFVIVQYESANRVSTNVYDATVSFLIPVSLSDIPVLATLVNVIGDITFKFKIITSARVDVATESISNLQFVSLTMV